MRLILCFWSAVYVIKYAFFGLAEIDFLAATIWTASAIVAYSNEKPSK